ncbi:amidase signature enzyme [Apiospora saccharicola]
MEAYQLSATQVLARYKDGSLTVEEYARSLLSRIEQRDATVKAWAYLDPEYVIEQAKALDQTPAEQRGPLHGVAVAVKDVIYTKDMPTQFNSPIYEGHAPRVDAASVAILREAGALLLVPSHDGGAQDEQSARSQQDARRLLVGVGRGRGRLPGPLGLGTQTGGSTIRPGSFNGIYAFKPTWNSISREGQKVYALLFDTLGLYARRVDDLELLADVFALHDDATPPPVPFCVRGAKFAMLKTVVWPEVGPGTAAAMEKAAKLLRAHGAEVDELELPPEFDDMPHHHRVVLHAEGRVAFLPEYRIAPDQLHGFLVGHVENEHKYTRADQLRAWDGMAALRPKVDAIAAGYAAIITPSVPDEAPVGLESTGSANFCSSWTVSRSHVY